MRRIGIVLTHLNPLRMGGAETYCRQLIMTLPPLAREERIVLFVGRDHGLRLEGLDVEVVQCDVDPLQHHRRILWEQTRLTSVLRRHDLSLVHFPYGTVPLRQRGPYLATIHDSQRFHLPKSMSWLERTYRDTVERVIAFRRQPVIGVSNWDAGVLRDRLGLDERRLFVVPYGVSEAFRIASGETPSRDDYALWVGRPYGRKNVNLLLLAWARLIERGVTPPTLRVVGVEPMHEAGLSSLVRQLGIERHVSLERPIPHERIPEVFRRARIFCYPSLYESFAIPVMEAMAAGVPVIGADIPAFRELYEGAALLRDPHDPEAWAEAVTQLTEDADAFDRLSRAGWERSQPYTWDRTARCTLDIYRQCLNPSG